MIPHMNAKMTNQAILSRRKSVYSMQTDSKLDTKEHQ